MEPLNKIRNELRRYVDGQTDFAQFRLWSANEYASRAVSEASAELQFLRSVESEVADFSEGMISESVLRESLSLLCDDNHIVFVLAENQAGQVVTGTSTVLSPVGTVAGQLVGVGPAWEYA